MNAFTLRQSLTTQGITLTVSDGQLLVKPASDLTDETRRLIREHKSELVGLILDHRQKDTQSTEVTRSRKPLLLEELESLLGCEVEEVEPDSTPSDDWDKLHDADQKFLTEPVNRSPPCRWCGAWNIHSQLCFSLHTDGPFVVRRGKHRGKPLATLPRDYLQWMNRKTRGELTPDWRAELHRLLHAGKHDYKAVQ